MTLANDGRTWSTEIELKYGRYQYKFIRNGSEWMTDPKAENNEDDGNGNINSVLNINPPDFSKPSKRGDGIISESAIEHKASLPYLNLDGRKCSIKLRTRKGDIASVVAIVNEVRRPCTIVFSDELYDFFQASFDWDGKSNLTYQFEVIDGTKKLKDNSLRFDIKAGTFSAYSVPKWVQHSVIYQIFPDRFENGDSSNDPKDLMPWDGKPTYANRFGGDIAGIEKRQTYLKSLGINAIYYNPIFKSPSNHRYEADNYVQLDPEFGTNREFIRLTKGLKAQGISTILDFAFNHTSIRSTEFQDLVKNGSNSKFKNWYFPKSYPVVPDELKTYEAWFGFGSMPKLNTVNPETTSHLLEVCKYWVNEVGIDGIRLDVANEVDSRFWRAMRPFVKSINKNLWILGEIWGDGNPWLQGDQFDSVMNYQFREAAIRFVAKNTQDATKFAGDLMRVHRSYPPQVSRNMMNLLSSHDTTRFITECGGDRELAKLGAALQFTWIGEPSIYYGEELGMEGGKDPDNRRGMDWSKATADNEMLQFYQKLIKVRQKTNAFSAGDAAFLYSDKDGGVFSREGQDDAALVFFNRSNQTKKFNLRVPKSVSKLAKKGLFDPFTGSGYLAPDRPIQVNVKPKSFAILVTKSSSNSSLSNRQFVGRGSVQRRADLTKRSLNNK